jgi:hypothetical protein
VKQTKIIGTQSKSMNEPLAASEGDEDLRYVECRTARCAQSACVSARSSERICGWDSIH